MRSRPPLRRPGPSCRALRVPDLAAAHLAAERIELPLRRVGEDDVRVRKEEQVRPAAATRNASDEIRTLRHARVELARHTVVLEVVAQELGGTSLVSGRIRRIDTD